MLILILIIVLSVILVIGCVKSRLIVKVLCIWDICAVLLIIFLLITATVHFGYGREFFKRNCNSIVIMEEYDDAMMLEMIASYKNKRYGFEYGGLIKVEDPVNEQSE